MAFCWDIILIDHISFQLWTTLQMRLKRFKQPWIWHIWTNTLPAFKLAQPVENPAQGAPYVWWTWVRTQVISQGKAIWCHLLKILAKKLRLLEVSSVGAKLVGMEATVTIWKVSTFFHIKYLYQVHNVCFIKIRNKHSSVLLLCLLRIFMKQTLWERWEVIPLLSHEFHMFSLFWSKKENFEVKIDTFFSYMLINF